MAIKVRFWGVRGSIPCPGDNTVKYGGNTACLELRFGDENRLVIVDAGSGIRELGNSLLRTDLPKGPLKTSIFITHTHWDHIMGYPFFTPIYIPKTELKVYGPVTYEEDTLDKIIGGQLRYRYFPVRQSELAAQINYYQLQETEMDLGGGLKVRTKYLNHPIMCLGYRFEFGGKSFCTVYDTEPFKNVFESDPASPDYDAEAFKEGEIAAKQENEKILKFIHGADLVVYDTQYTHKEYTQGKVGWGHSTFEFAINAGHKAGVKKLLFFHHDPMRTDKELDELVLKYQKQIQGKSKLQFEAAYEGQLITI
ncbi:MAG: MBL fold metallo-hydrolase [Spirochaetaceae bacterium]|nr:MAG: MBL fold metallo-hydrolase [Spirochaetaceae bacterium]